MPSISSDSRLFGVDLHLLWTEVRQTWSGLHDWPVFSWMTPAPQVVLLHSDGGQSFWRDGLASATPVGNVRTSFTALDLPDDYVLRRSLTLPAMSAGDVQRAVALEAKAASPFAQGDLVWGYVHQSLPHGANRVGLVIASRRQVAEYIESQRGRLGDIEDVEVWVRNPMATPTVLQGYAEGLRLAHARRWRNTAYALLALSVMLLGSVAISPTLQLRSRALDAAETYQQTSQRVAPIVKERERLMQSAEKLNALSEVFSGRIEPLKVLERLTQVLPDDTALQSFKLQGQKVTLAGVTANSSNLLQLLGGEPGFHEVKAPSAATRLSGAAKETFVIELMLDAQHFGVAKSGGRALPPPSGPTASMGGEDPPRGAASVPGGASSMAPTGAGSPAASPAIPASASAVVAPASAPGAAPGGARATFGGTRPPPAPAAPKASTGGAPS